MYDDELYIKDLPETLTGMGWPAPNGLSTKGAGEEDDGPTTFALGEEGDQPTTFLVGEEAEEGPKDPSGSRE